MQLKKISAKEIPFRMGQQWFRWTDRMLPCARARRSDGKVTIRSSIVSEVRNFMDSESFTKVEERFFISFSRKREIRTILTIDFQYNNRLVGETAKSILRREVSLFGRKLYFGERLTWHDDPVYCRTSPRRFHADIDFLDFNQVGDHKIIWELNRHTYFFTLARAYWATGDDTYGLEWLRHIDSWIRSNPPKIGINWASSLEIAYRSISWILSYLFFHRSDLLSRGDRLQILGMLYINGIHIERNLSYYFSPNTHLTGEALGLIYLGLFFSGTEYGNRWVRKGRDILEKQIDIHVKADGTYFEQSAYYHRYTTDIYLHAWILMNRNGLPFASAVRDGIRRLLDFLVMTQLPEGRTPLFGDDDGGRLLFLNCDPYDDFRSCLSTGAVLFNREDYKKMSGGYNEETLWLLGPDSKRVYDGLGEKTPDVLSICLPEGGYCVMRNGWNRNSDYMLIDCGPHGWGSGGHAHADLLNVIVAVSGKECLIDPGTYTYSESSEWRNRFRVSQAHNTVSTEGQSQSLPGKPFSWLETGRVLNHQWCASKEIDFFSGKVSVFNHTEAPAMHTRDIIFLKTERTWIIRDRMRSDLERNWELNLHFPSQKVEARGNRFSLSDENGPYADLLLFSCPEGNLILKDDWRSRVYALKEISKTGVCRVRGKEAVMITVIQALPRTACWEYSHSADMDRLCCSDPDRAARIEICADEGGPDYAAAVHFSSEKGAESIYAQCRGFNFRGILNVGFNRTIDCVKAVQDENEIHITCPPAEECRIMQSKFPGFITINGRVIGERNRKCAESAV